MDKDQWIGIAALVELGWTAKVDKMALCSIEWVAPFLYYALTARCECEHGELARQNERIAFHSWEKNKHEASRRYEF